MINYEEEYQNSRNVCGGSFQEIVEFFENYDDECATVLDSGCRQGRDVLFIARKGHSVLGVDTAQTGIEQIGINRVTDDKGKSRIVGDSDFDSCSKKAGWITPVPGGVGSGHGFLFDEEHHFSCTKTEVIL